MDSQPSFAPHKFSFKGTGGQLFIIQLVNVLLCIVTLGIYYPWARVNVMRFLYEESLFQGQPFTFHGTGKEMFIGFLKLIGIYALIALMVVYGGGIGIALAYFALLLLIPVAIHGLYKYRMSRSSWQDIRFSYHGDLGELIKICVKGILLTILTFGIYGAWFSMELNRYVIGNVQAGSAKFGFDGKGNEYFKIFFIGYLLTIVTFGIYGFWWIRDLFNFSYNHTFINLEEESYAFKGNITVGKVFELTIVNILIVVFTLGIGTPWALVRTLRYSFDHIELDGAFDVSRIQPVEHEDFSDALGEGLIDSLI